MKLLVVLVVPVVVVAGAGCNFIRCNDDGDCPAEVPFCNAETCQATPGGERAEGEGEGEASGCDADADCDKDLCYDLVEGAAHFEAALVDSCVPGADDDRSCAEAGFIPSTNGDRPNLGQSIFKANAARTTPLDCGTGQSDVQLDVLYLDREGDFNIASTLMFVPQGGSSPEFSSGSVSGDGTSGQGFFILRCVSDSATYVAIALGEGSATSSSLCVPLGAP